MTENDELHPVREALTALGEALSADQGRKLQQYHDLLVSSNPRYSLISPADVRRIRDRHFVESVQLLRWVPPQSAAILDIGSGGGLPGLVLKIMRPDATVVLLERRRRKQVFLRFAVHRLGLAGIHVFGSTVDLADESVGQPALRFDCVVARAVGPLAELLPLAAPLLRPDGVLIAPKGSRADEDLAAAAGALQSSGLILAERRGESLTSPEGGLIHRATLIFRRRTQ
ncbi:MAG: 16S rRNA (guanine(527)-N(7))-methyltransferase RsmG [bacterium]